MLLRSPTILVALSAIVIGAGCTKSAQTAVVAKQSASPPPDPRIALLATAKEKVTHDFYDPASAQFRDIAYYNLSSDPTVCGEVNGKNLNGAYAGFHRFFANPKRGVATVVSSSDDGIRKVEDGFADLACKEAVPSAMASTSTTTTDTKEVATPLPPGYRQVASLAYADDRTVDPQAQSLLQQTSGSPTVTVQIDGDAVELRPRLMASHGDRSLIVLTGKNGECHVCSGVIQLYSVTQANSTIEGALAGDPVQFGSWGEPAAVQVFDKPNAPTMLRYSYDYTQQGCSAKEGQLFRRTAMGLEPVAKSYEVDGGGCS